MTFKTSNGKTGRSRGEPFLPLTCLRRIFTNVVHRDLAAPYLQYVKAISAEWPHLKLLADFMEVGTDPTRWRNFHGNDQKNAYTYPDDREDRGEFILPQTRYDRSSKVDKDNK